LRNTAFIATGLALLLVQENLFRVLGWLHVPGLSPSLVLPLVLFMGVHEYSLARCAAVAFLLGYVSDLVGIAPVGLYTFTYVGLFLLARAASVRLAAQTVMMQIGLTLVFTLIHSVMILVLLAIFGRDAYVPRALYPMILPHVLATAAVAPLVFRLAQSLQSATVLSRARETE
jgi:rod shape-determining protein MreD